MTLLTSSLGRPPIRLSSSSCRADGRTLLEKSWLLIDEGLPSPKTVAYASASIAYASLLHASHRSLGMIACRADRNQGMWQTR